MIYYAIIGFMARNKNKSQEFWNTWRRSFKLWFAVLFVLLAIFFSGQWPQDELYSFYITYVGMIINYTSFVLTIKSYRQQQAI